jgi:hypothetical protein
MDKGNRKIYGLLAKFDSPEALISATKRAYDGGYRQFDTYAPFPVEGLPEAMRLKTSLLPYVILAGGIIGGLTGFFGQAFATVIDYPLNIGGRPLLSWPAYIPITFELTVLFAAFAGVIGLFAATRFPQPYHPVFNSEDFNQHASQDAFYLDIQASDPKFSLESTRTFMESLGSIQVSEIEA